jgi:hypothetical protein
MACPPVVFCEIAVHISCRDTIGVSCKTSGRREQEPSRDAEMRANVRSSAISRARCTHADRCEVQLWCSSAALRGRSQHDKRQYVALYFPCAAAHSIGDAMLGEVLADRRNECRCVVKELDLKVSMKFCADCKNSGYRKLPGRSRFQFCWTVPFSSSQAWLPETHLAPCSPCYSSSITETASPVTSKLCLGSPRYYFPLEMSSLAGLSHSCEILYSIKYEIYLCSSRLAGVYSMHQSPKNANDFFGVPNWGSRRTPASSRQEKKSAKYLPRGHISHPLLLPIPIASTEAVFRPPRTNPLHLQPSGASGALAAGTN